MKPWFIREDNVVPFPKKDKGVVRLPNVNAYPDFLTGVQDLQNHLKRGDISSDIHKKLYQDLIHRFMKVESFETPWFLGEVEAQTNIEYQKLIQLLQSQGLKVGQPKLSRTHKKRHIRVGAAAEKIADILKKTGATVKIIPAPNTLSSTYDQIYVGFPKNYNDKNLAGREYNVASALKKGRSVGIKVFTPTNLGLTGKTFSRSALYQQLKNTITSSSILIQKIAEALM